MISSQDFDKLSYKKPRLNDERPKLPKIMGIDSEAYFTGVPFMFCISDGTVLKPEQIPEIFFTEKYIGANFVIYNMKYDSGALLYHLPRKILYQLWETNKTEFGDIKYEYIPHKLLRLKKGKNKVSFWDISQFYKMSLDKAAKKYLNKSKLETKTKNFTESYVKRTWKHISKYCIQDAVLTKELGEYLVNKLDEFGITASALYSCASISFRYFCDNSKIITSWEYWKYQRELLQFACDAYRGGKFEVTIRGQFTAHEYDITSAYPYEIANLLDTSNAYITRGRNYENQAHYGFIRCYIDNSKGYYLPCGPVLKNGICFYPAGKFFLTVTKQEFDYMRSIGVHLEILDAYWLFIARKRYPYRETIHKLFKIKDSYKGKDAMLYYVSKIVMNSFYGKCVQVIEDYTGQLNAGMGWNPIYGAIITANTRIRVTEIQNIMKSDCLAVHTDSVFVKNPIPKSYIKKELGAFEHVITGSGILIACGMYQIGDECAFKGFKPNKLKSGEYDTWEQILSRHKYRKKIKYKQLHVESWIEAMAKNHEKECINVFADDTKVIDLNCDSKRIWPIKTNAKNLLENQYQSIPKIHIENEPPKYWNIS